VLEAGTRDLAEIWSMAPSGPGRAVRPAVARITRVCAYDRPGTYLFPDELGRSDPVAMPRSARHIVLDLRALLRAAHVRGPYVLAGHSFGAWSRASTPPPTPEGSPDSSPSTPRTRDYAAAYKQL
jgi:hypothetical protein